MLQDKMALKKQTNNGWMELYLKPPFILQKIVFTFKYFENWLSGSIPGLKLIVMDSISAKHKVAVIQPGFGGTSVEGIVQNPVSRRIEVKHTTLVLKGA